MGLLIDVVIVVIFVLNVYVGYKKGLINVIFNILAFFIALAISLILYKPVSNIIIENTNIKQNIKSMIINNNQEENKEEKSTSNGIQSYIENAVQGVAEEAKSQATEVAAETISVKAIEILACVILFIFTRVVLIILKFFTEAVSNLPIIKQLNGIGGIAYGVAKGLIIVYLILTVLYIVISINGNGKIANAIEESYVTNILYNNNIIVNYCLLGKNLL